jgi:hypothetical protein
MGDNRERTGKDLFFRPFCRFFAAFSVNFHSLFSILLALSLLLNNRETISRGTGKAAR